jgi:hypothetical protein
VEVKVTVSPSTAPAAVKLAGNSVAVVVPSYTLLVVPVSPGVTVGASV